jgi:putative nucleotidyltransferase with HDIG domain
MDTARRAEQLIVKIRWAALTVAVFMIGGDLPLQSIAAPVLAVIIYNLAAHYVNSKESLFFRIGPRIGLATRLFDVFWLTLALACAGTGTKSLYLLYFLTIVSTGYATASTRQILMMSCLCAVCNAGAASFHGGLPMRELLKETWTQTVVLGAGALLSAYVYAYKRQDESMRRKERKLSALFECGTRFTSERDVARILDHVLRTAIKETDATGGSLMLVDSERDELYVESAVGLEEVIKRNARVRFGDGIAGHVAKTGQPLVLHSGEEDERFPDIAKRQELASSLCVPLLDKSASASDTDKPKARVLGVLAVNSKIPLKRFDQDDLDLAVTLASLASMALVNSRLYTNLRENFVKTMQSLARSLEARDAYTQGHSWRVSEVSQMVARELGVRDDVVEAIKNAALLHDIGKIGIPDAVLQKPAKLSPEEMRTIQKHSELGEAICRPLDIGEDALFLIRHHQERLDGTGYPDRLAYDQQPLSLRILSAVDALDAMSSDRPYRKAMDLERRVEELNRVAGTQFDPVVVETVKGLLLSGRLDPYYPKDSPAVVSEELDKAA